MVVCVACVCARSRERDEREETGKKKIAVDFFRVGLFFLSVIGFEAMGL